MGKSERPPATLNGAKWGNSDAKKQIAQDVIDGHTPCIGKVNIEEIFNRLCKDDPQFKNFPFDKTRHNSRLATIRGPISKLAEWAEHDDKAIQADLKRHPQKEKNIRGQLRWEGSKAQESLEIDMQQGLHLVNKPAKLHKTREEYQLFDLEVFRKHIHQAAQSKKKFKGGNKRRKKGHYGDKSFSREPAQEDTASPSS